MCTIRCKVVQIDKIDMEWGFGGLLEEYSDISSSSAYIRVINIESMMSSLWGTYGGSNVCNLILMKIMLL